MLYVDDYQPTCTIHESSGHIMDGGRANNEALSPNLNLLATAGHQGGPTDDQPLAVHDLQYGKVRDRCTRN